MGQDSPSRDKTPRMTSRASVASRRTFCGREQELTRLSHLFDTVAAERTPRLAVIAGESGLGKTALVQQFYCTLCTNASPNDFWPDAFQTLDDLGVNPTFPRGHKATSPPPFMWLGMRWPEPDPPNSAPTNCQLPVARDVLERHHRVSEATRPPLKRYGRSLLRQCTTALRDSAGAIAARVSEIFSEFLPLVGYVLKLLFRAGRETLDHSEASHYEVRKTDEQRSVKAIDREISRLMTEALPTIIWLDDAQWIDDSTYKFLADLCDNATHKHWPLFVLATHWDREYQNSPFAGHESERPLVCPALLEVIHLNEPSDELLHRLLADRLPGLTLDQQVAVIGKSNCNFLCLTQNIDWLKSVPDNFAGPNRTGPLTPAGEKEVLNWDTQRTTRLRQRFNQLDADVRLFLALCARLGPRFVRKLVADFLNKCSQDSRPTSRLLESVNRSAILAGSKSGPVWEFRDPAYRKLANRHFELYHHDLEPTFSAFRRRWYRDWINDCFNSNGLVRSDAPARWSLLSSPREMRSELLEKASQSLPLHEVSNQMRGTRWAASGDGAPSMTVIASVRTFLLSMKARFPDSPLADPFSLTDLEFHIVAMALDPDTDDAFTSIDWAGAPAALGPHYCQENSDLLEVLGLSDWRLAKYCVGASLRSYARNRTDLNLGNLSQSLKQYALLGLRRLSADTARPDDDPTLLLRPNGHPRSGVSAADRRRVLVSVRNAATHATTYCRERLERSDADQDREDLKETQDLLSEIKDRLSRHNEARASGSEAATSGDRLNESAKQEEVSRPPFSSPDEHGSLPDLCLGEVADKLFQPDGAFSTIGSLLAGRGFVSAEPEAQLRIVRILQKYGRIHIAAKLADSVSDTRKNGRSEEVGGRMLLLKLKLASQGQRFTEVIRMHARVDRALCKVAPERRISGFHRLAVACAVEGRVQESREAFEEARKLACRHELLHAELTGLMLRSLARVFRWEQPQRASANATEDAARRLREVQSQYLVASVHRSLDQADRRKAFLVALFSEAAVLLRSDCAERAGWYALGVASCVAESVSLWPTAEGFAELCGLVDVDPIKNWLRDALRTDSQLAEFLFRKEFRKNTGMDLEKVRRDVRRIGSVTSDSWNGFRRGFDERLRKLGSPV